MIGFLLAAMITFTCDGVDDTARIQAAVDQATAADTVVAPPGGSCRVNPRVGVKLASNKRLELGDATFDIGANVPSTMRVLETVPWSTDITIRGGVIVGSRVRVPGMTLAHFGIGIRIDTASRVLVEGTVLRDWWYDGIYVGGNMPGSNDVTIRGVLVTGARRNGMSIANGGMITVERSTFELTYDPESTPARKNLPQCGLDAEPNAGGDRIRGLRLRDNVFRLNTGYGAFIQSPHGEVNEDFEVVNNRFENNVGIGLAFNTTKRAVIAWNTFVGGSDGLSIGAGAKSVVAAYNDISGASSRAMIASAVEDPIFAENDLHGGKFAIVGIMWPSIGGVFRNGVFGQVWMRGNE